MAERLLSDDELAALSRTPRQQFEAALAVGAAEARSAWEATESAFRRFADGFDAWASTIVDFVTDRHGPGGGAALLDVFETLGSVADTGLTLDDRRVLDDPGPPTPAPSTDDAWLAAYDAMERSWQRLHDVRVDRVAAMLSTVYSTYGIDELEASLRDSGDRTMLARFDRDVERPVVDRLRFLAAGLGGNFASITVEEHDDEFVIRQHPCGTCGRQLERGRYEPDGPLAVVSERSPLTYGRGDTPIYRCHVPVMHFLMPGERIGAPWPEIVCPPGRTVGPCVIRIAKDWRAGDPAWADPATAAARSSDNRED